MNRNALQKLSYGVYVITTAGESKSAGCVANSVMQITSAPAQIAVSLNHDNATHDEILKNKKFAISILATDTVPSIIGGFGYRSSRDVDKFEDVACEIKDGIPVLQAAMAWITCKVVNTMNCGTHTIILGEVMDGEVVNEGAIPMTYLYYHSVIKGKSPKNAPTYLPEE